MKKSAKNISAGQVIYFSDLYAFAYQNYFIQTPIDGRVSTCIPQIPKTYFF
jgi:hypothetical protein